MNNIVIGKIVKPQGIKGEVKVAPITDDVSRFNKLEYVFVGDDELKVDAVKIREGMVYLTLSTVDSRDKAEALRNKMLSVPREQANTLEEGSWFIVDLVGCEVFDSDGVKLGKLTDVLQNGSADVYCVDGNKIMFPALKVLLKSVDIYNKKIIVDKQVLSEVAVYEN